MIAIVALALSACVPGGPAAAPVPPELAWMLTQSTPADVTPTADPARAATAVIPVSGGALTATAEDGTTYTLTIPAGALRTATAVTLTPVTSLAGSPFDETASYGVEVGPDGTQLDAYATIEIVPATPIPADQQLLFQYRGEGDDLRFALPTPGASAAVSISTDHFSGYGTAATAPNKVQEAYRLGGDAADAIESELDHRIQLQSQPRADGSRAPINLDDLQPFFDLYRDYVVEARLAHATDSCAAGLVAAETYNHFQKKLALLGAEEQPDGRWPEIVKTVAATCIDQEYTYCTKEHLVYRILPLYVAMIRMLAKAGIEDGDVLDQLKDKVVGCLSFRLDFQSDATVEGDTGWESSVEASVDLEFDPSAVDSKGIPNPQFRPATGTLTNTSVTAQEGGWSGCSATATPTDGELDIRSMEILASGYDAEAVDAGQQRVGQLDDIRLLFNTTLAGGELKITCPSQTFQVPTIPGMWFSPFLASHQDEIDQSPTDGGVRFTGWQPGAPGDAVVAERTWTATGDRVHESGTFTLTHTPH